MALLTVKDAVSQASLEIGITQRPVSQAVGSLDQDIVQMTALLSAVADEVLDEEPYQETLGDGYWLVGADGITKKTVPTADTDLAAKGLEFGEPMRDFATRINKLAGRANNKVLDLYSESDGGRIQ
jgi:hypothetical protein